MQPPRAFFRLAFLSLAFLCSAAAEAADPESAAPAERAPGAAEERAPAPPDDAPPAGEATEREAAGEAAPAEGAAPPGGAGEPGEIPPRSDLSELVVPVDEISRTAARAERDVLDVPGNVTRIDRAAIERSGARDVADLLRREAGVFVVNTTTNRAGYMVELRGFNNGGGNGSSTLVLIDGRRLNEPTSTFVDWAFIPLDNIESIEIVRGPVSALYGDNALAGVIHIRTLEPEKGIRGILSGRTGTYDTDGGSLWVGGGAGPVRASAYLEGESTDGYRDRSDLRNHRGQIDFAFDLGERGTLGLRGGYDSDVRQFPGALTEPEIEEDRRQATPGSEDDFMHARERFGQLYFDYALTEHLTVRFDGWHRRRGDRSLASDPFFAFRQESDVDANGLTALLELDVELCGHRNRTIVGGELLQEDFDTDSLLELFPSDPFSTLPSTSRARRKLYGLFLQNELNLTEDLILSAGVRRESARYRGDREDIVGGVAFASEFSARFHEWAPKAALTWRVLEPISVYASYARGFRLPNRDEAFGFFGFSPALAPQTSDAYEAGVKVRTRRASFNLAVYHMDVEDEIFFDPIAPNPLIPDFPVIGINANLDRVRHRGVEFWANVRPWDWLELYGGYTYDDVKIQRDSLTELDGRFMPITPRHRGTAGAIVFLPFGFEVGVNANYVGSRFVANDVLNVFDELPSYASYDARVGWRHPLGEHVRLALDAIAYNVTGREYSEFGGLSVFSPRIGFFPSPGRHYLVVARIEVRR